MSTAFHATTRERQADVDAAPIVRVLRLRKTKKMPGVFRHTGRG